MLRNVLSSVVRVKHSYLPVASIHTAVVDSAARKGTREKARKKKVKVEVKKLEFVPHNQREYNKLVVKRLNLHVDDTWKTVPKDANYLAKYYRWKVFSFEEAVQSHRETHHPSMYNEPDADLVVHVELNMVAEKQTRTIDDFRNIVMVDHTFDHGTERKIIVLAKGSEFHQEAQAAGATMYGGSELVKDVQNGELNLKEYDYILAHPNILPDLVTLRGLLKKRFPSPKSGTLGVNITEMVNKFKNGIQYSAEADDNQNDFGLVTTAIGKLSMDTKHLEANLKAVLEDINNFRPKREGRFITRVLLKSPPSKEMFKIDPFQYVDEEYKRTGKKVDAVKDGDVVEEDEEKAQVAQ